MYWRRKTSRKDQIRHKKSLDIDFTIQGFLIQNKLVYDANIKHYTFILIVICFWTYLGI